MRTTLTIERDVAVRLERLRKHRGGSFKAIVNEVLRKGLESSEARRKAPKRFRIKTFDLGKCALDNVDNIAEVLAFAEGEDFK